MLSKPLAPALDFLSFFRKDEERIVLLAMHKLLVERALCLREHTESGTLLIFPSYYRRERKELTGHPAVQVSYRFHGFLDDIYATLVVRLHYAQMIENDELWRYAADFRTLTGKQLGVKLVRLGEGAGELEVYFDPSIPVEEKIIFSKYVHEHLMGKGREVERLRHYVCPHCGTEVFEITKERHAKYWREQAFPVLLVIRKSNGEVRWMEIRDYLKCESDNGKKAVKQIVFEGERFDVMSVRRWRDKILAGDDR